MITANKDKVNFSCAHDDGTYREEQLYTGLNRSFIWRGVVRFFFTTTNFPSDKELVPLNMRLGWQLNQSQCFVEAKNLLTLQGI